jgi:hypothetical protein
MPRIKDTLRMMRRSRGGVNGAGGQNPLLGGMVFVLDRRFLLPSAVTWSEADEDEFKRENLRREREESLAQVRGPFREKG